MVEAPVKKIRWISIVTVCMAMLAVACQGVSGKLLLSRWPQPQVATALTPANGATGQLTVPTFTWTAGANAASHTLYVGSSNPPTTVYYQGAATSFAWSAASPLSYSTTYYVRVVSYGGRGGLSSVSTAVQSFTTEADPGAGTGEVHFYLNPVTGSDDANGLDASHAWKTIAKVASSMPSDANVHIAQMDASISGVDWPAARTWWATTVSQYGHSWTFSTE
jgi:hypothetical protein